MTWSERSARWDFLPARFPFALRTALGGCLALLIAWAIGLEHPQWSAMTVFAAAQPVRNMLVEKSFFRALGTVAGVLVGICLIVGAGQDTWLLVVGLALWVSLCAGLGNVLRGFVSYGAILAGYSAAMVALLETAHPGHLWALGLDRALTVLVGVATGVIVAMIFLPKETEAEIAGKTRRLTARVLRAMADFARDGQPPAADIKASLLAEMAEIDEGIDPHGAGSLASRQSARALRAVIAAQVSAVVHLSTARSVSLGNTLAEIFDRAGEALESADIAAATVALEQAARLADGHPGLREILQRQAAALRNWSGRDLFDPDHTAALREERDRLLHAVVLHRDWVGARQAALRAFGVMMLVGLGWVATGWHAGPYVLLGTSVMISLFSTFENPAFMMRNVLAGQLAGAVAALICRWLVWPFAPSEIWLVLLIMPFIFSGVLPISHRRTMLGGTDYIMILLLLSQPAYPLSGTFSASLSIAAAVVVAPAIALLAYRLVFPTDARRRLETLIAMMVREIGSIAAAPDAVEHRPVWRARLYHRLLRLVRLAQTSGERRFSPADGGLAVHALGLAAISMHAQAEDASLPAGARRGIRLALRRLERIAEQPEQVPAALLRAAGRLERAGAGNGEVVRAAADAMMRNRAFFERAGKGRPMLLTRLALL
ncbi:FUSC family protein [Rhizobium sp. LjRoot30]|uniref:FUSC family protein n=1 Tax=Rhizobium sp. LjRoot30 TaxID=3342320 RepID=UPI003ED0A066